MRTTRITQKEALLFKKLLSEKLGRVVKQRPAKPNCVDSWVDFAYKFKEWIISMSASRIVVECTDKHPSFNAIDSFGKTYAHVVTWLTDGFTTESCRDCYSATEAAEKVLKFIDGTKGGDV